MKLKITIKGKNANNETVEVVLEGEPSKIDGNDHDVDELLLRTEQEANASGRVRMWICRIDEE